MAELFITIAIVLYCFTKTVFAHSSQPPTPPAPSLEEQLNGILAQYLSQGVKLKIEKDR